ncbi:hypothetical protein ACOCG7_12275 [Paraburkholderia sp. DD10]|uniref:Uncharacterized protein n=1 Tax=Paraburkholderia terricola TaxID=169427 RepID=A0A1M6N2Z2_9BURK|nr:MULTISPECIES: hypothetical protein [Paraburkholderia]ORC51664.1 hypothetical protein B2G74_02915 [Burkholderia sp. A27]SDO72805.1 hypothetical protein SAMN05192547_102537 [Paraburkholderia sediminicola]SHJ90100.1 hypothetical protein SAMN05192548_100937 [Paraburkholderia terricola]
MNGTKRQPGGRYPASLADIQLEHLENMVEYLSREGGAGVTHPLGQDYWEKRIRALEETHELIGSQRQRLTRLLTRLGNEAPVANRGREG